jgi:hypothetical protein
MLAASWERLRQRGAAGLDPGTQEQDGPARDDRREQAAAPEPPFTEVLERECADR